MTDRTYEELLKLREALLDREEARLTEAYRFAAPDGDVEVPYDTRREIYLMAYRWVDDHLRDEMTPDEWHTYTDAEAHYKKRRGRQRSAWQIVESPRKLHRKGYAIFGDFIEPSEPTDPPRID